MKRLFLVLMVLALSVPVLAQTWSKELEKAAKKGDVTAQLAVGNAYFNGDGVNADKEKAAQWYSKAALANSAEAKEKLYSFYSKELEKLAKKGDVEAQLSVAKALMKTGENPKAAKWLYQAAVTGNKEAETLLFSFYSKELEKYAKEGNAEAQFQTGECYYKGSGVAKNLKKAAVWYDLATAQNHSEASARLGSFYSAQLAKRAKEGNSEMQYRLGLCYLNGFEVGRDVEAAAKWLEMSMLQRHKEAGKVFFATDSKLKRKRVKTLQTHPMMVYTGYAPGNIFKGYDISASPVAELSIICPNMTLFNGYFDARTRGNKKPIVKIKGEKRDGKYIDAVLEIPEENVRFDGNVKVEGFTEGAVNGNTGVERYHGVNVQISLGKGGKLNAKGHNFILNEDFAFLITPSRYNRETWSYESKQQVLSSEAVTMSIDKLLESSEWLSGSMKSNSASDLKEMAKTVVDITNVSMATCELGSLFQTSSGNLQVVNMLPDTINFEEGCLYLDKDNGCVVFEGKNKFDKLVLSSYRKYDYYSKVYKDGIVKFKTSPSESDIVFHDGERFNGFFQLGDLLPGGNLESTTYGGLKALWNKENISDVPFTIIKGTYTDATGKSEKWQRGLSELGLQILGKINKVLEDEANKKHLAYVEKLKKNTSAAKKQLIAEGFNKADVVTLLDKCIVRKGMSLGLIQRANDLGCNLEIVAPMEVDGCSRLLIEIYDQNSGAVAFQSFVGFNIFGQVSILESF